MNPSYLGVVDSSSEEDEEWTPLGEWRKRMKKVPKTSYGKECFSHLQLPSFGAVAIFLLDST